MLCVSTKFGVRFVVQLLSLSPVLSPILWSFLSGIEVVFMFSVIFSLFSGIILQFPLQIRRWAMAGHRSEEEACAKIFPARKRCLRGAGKTRNRLPEPPDPKAKTKKTTSTSTSMVAVTDDVTKLREQIDSSSCVNNGRKYSETKKKSVLDSSWQVCCVV